MDGIGEPATGDRRPDVQAQHFQRLVFQNGMPFTQLDAHGMQQSPRLMLSGLQLLPQGPHGQAQLAPACTRPHALDFLRLQNTGMPQLAPLLHVVGPSGMPMELSGMQLSTQMINSGMASMAGMARPHTGQVSMDNEALQGLFNPSSQQLQYQLLPQLLQPLRMQLVGGSGMATMATAPATATGIAGSSIHSQHPPLARPSISINEVSGSKSHLQGLALPTAALPAPSVRPASPTVDHSSKPSQAGKRQRVESSAVKPVAAAAVGSKDKSGSRRISSTAASQGSPDLKNDSGTQNDSDENAGSGVEGAGVALGHAAAKANGNTGGPAARHNATGGTPTRAKRDKNKNKEAQQRFRNRQKAQIASMKADIQVMQEQLTASANRIQGLEVENIVLKAKLEALQGAPVTTVSFPAGAPLAYLNNSGA